MNDKCQRSAQCEAVDPDTYCTFKGECRCKDGRRCRDPSSVPCSASSDCGPKQYCSRNRCRVLKTLRSLCTHDQQCQENAYCSTRLRVCTCKGGYKESSKAVCIPEKYCENKLDCKGGYCEDNECRDGVSLGGLCAHNKQCQAIDENSECHEHIDGRTCTCIVFYKMSTKGICIPDDRCLVDADCPGDQDKPSGKCLLNECIYPRLLGEACDISDQCLLQTDYSVCLGDCRCLNPTDDRSSVCNGTRACRVNDDCLDHQICRGAVCECEEGHKYYHDGLCYKIRPRIPRGKFHVWPSNCWPPDSCFIIFRLFVNSNVSISLRKHHSIHFGRLESRINCFLLCGSLRFFTLLRVFLLLSRIP